MVCRWCIMMWKQNFRNAIYNESTALLLDVTLQLHTLHASPCWLEQTANNRGSDMWAVCAVGMADFEIQSRIHSSIRVRVHFIWIIGFRYKSRNELVRSTSNHNDGDIAKVILRHLGKIFYIFFAKISQEMSNENCKGTRNRTVHVKTKTTTKTNVRLAVLWNQNWRLQAKSKCKT